jgi:RimJ/RimL family protein N-acetyltransferase
MSDQPELADGVLRLRRFELSDVASVHPLEDAEMIRWFGFPRPSRPDDLRAAVKAWHSAWTDGRRAVTYLATLAEDGTPVGMCELRAREHEIGELSWATYAPYRHRGYATRAVRLLVGFGFAQLRRERVEAYVELGNTGSLRVAESVGLLREGVLRGRERIGRHRRDLALYARLSTDPWPLP